MTARIAELGGDILDISQTLVGDYFTMIVVVDTATLDVAFADFKAAMEAEVAVDGPAGDDDARGRRQLAAPRMMRAHD